MPSVTVAGAAPPTAIRVGPLVASAEEPRERRGRARVEPKRWRAHLPVFASVFVILALVALVITPVTMTWRHEALEQEGAVTTDRAHALTDSLKSLFVDEILLLHHIRTGDTLAAVDYRVLRAAQELLIKQLREVAPAISAEAAERVGVIAAVSARWHVVPDALAARRINEEQAVHEMSRILADRDSMLATERLLDADIDRSAERRRIYGAQLLQLQRTFSFGLGVMGALATIVVAWFARRERRLTRALERSISVSDHRRAELEEITESRNRLMRGFSHDVKNPIGAADGYMQLLEDGILGPVAERQQLGIAGARRSLAAAISLIGDLLELAKTAANNVTISLVPTDVRAVAREAGEQYRAQAEAKGLVMRIEADRHVPTILSDPIRVRQVLGNLISNAVKYTATGYVTVRVGDEEGSECFGRISISVSDTGLGIAEEHQHLLFREFTRLEPAAGPGVGIGLAISARIVEALGGTITVRSVSGHGSEFVLWLPTNEVGLVSTQRA